MSFILAGAVMGLGDGMLNLADEQKKKAAEKREIELERAKRETAAQADQDAISTIYGLGRRPARPDGDEGGGTDGGSSSGRPRTRDRNYRNRDRSSRSSSRGGIGTDDGNRGGIGAPSPATSGDGFEPGDKSSFVQAMMPHAMRVSEQTGLDPRLVIAQAAQETGWGESALNNNYFGIKSHGREGGANLRTNEVVNGETVRTNDSFRTYDGMSQSADDYARFLQENPRYREMLSADDLDGQIAALGRSGYATDPNYAKSVGSIARSIPPIGQAGGSEKMSAETIADDAPSGDRGRGLGRPPRRDGDTRIASADDQALLDIVGNPDVSAGVRNEAIKKLAERRQENPPDYESYFWQKNGDGTETRMATNNNNGRIEPVLGRDGEPVTQQVKENRDGVELSASLDKRLRSRFQDAVGGPKWGKIDAVKSEMIRLMEEEDLTETEAEQKALSIDTRLRSRFQDAVGDPEWGKIDAVKSEMIRLMEEEDLTETEAEQKALSGMVFEDEVTSDGNFLGFGKETSIERNKEGRGEFTGEFSYGNPEPQPTPSIPRDTQLSPQPAQPSRGSQNPPQPKNEAEYKALPSGTRFMDPEGNIRVKP